MRRCKVCGKLKLVTKLNFKDGTCLCLQDSCIDKFKSRLQIPDVPHGKCSICGKKRITDIGVWMQETYKVCKTCNLVLHRYVLTPAEATFPEVVQQYHNALLPPESDFDVTFKVNDYLFVDEEKLQWIIPYIDQDIMRLKRATEKDVHSFSDIARYELIEEINNVVVKSSVGVIGRSFVGGIIAGPVGAAIGAVTANQEYKTNEYCTSMKLRIYLTGVEELYEEIVFVKEKTARKSTAYSNAINAANKCISAIEMYSQGSSA